MNVERLRRAKPVHVPDVGHQLLPRDHAARLAREPDKQIELLAGEAELVIAPPYPAGALVDPKVLDVQLSALRRLWPTTPQDGSNSSDHLASRERLDNVVISAQLKPDDTIGDRPAGRDHDDRNARVAPDLPADVASVTVR